MIYGTGQRVMWRASFVWADTIEQGTVIGMDARKGVPTPRSEEFWQEWRMYAPHVRYWVRWNDGAVSHESIANIMRAPDHNESLLQYV